MRFTLGKNLKMTRIESGLSVASVCLILKEKFSYPISKKTYYKWESGEINSSRQSMAILAKIFHTTVSGILTINAITQVLTSEENDFINAIRVDKSIRSIVKALTEVNKEVFRHEFKLCK